MYSQPAGRKIEYNTKIQIYRKVIDEVIKEYENTREFIHIKINELCSEHEISTDEVCLYACYATYTVWLRTQFRANLFSLSS